jgi:hypothetical protein
MTLRLPAHWWHHEFANQIQFFCQIEAVETLIWLTVLARPCHLKRTPPMWAAFKYCGCALIVWV